MALRFVGSKLCQLLVPSSRISANTASRNIHTSSVARLKEIRQEEVNDKIIIEGNIIASDRENYLVPIPEAKSGCCPICRLNLEVMHTDVLILSQFLRSDGCLLPKRITGLCTKQQRRMSKLVAMAQKAGLLSCINPSYSKKDPKLRYRWKKFNSYYDEKTIDNHKIK